MSPYKILNSDLMLVRCVINILLPIAITLPGILDTQALNA